MEGGGGLAVSARGLEKAYGGIAAVRGIDFDIAVGERFGFLGPNGAGKTTTMRMLACLARRDAGELTVLGVDPEREPRGLKRELGVVAQEVNLDLELTVLENLMVYARYFDIPRVEAGRRAAELLDFVQLSDRARDPVERLSGGMMRRLQIARALVNRPRLVLLDEPTTGLDPQARHLVWERLRRLTHGGVTLVLTTHYMEEAAQLCDRLVIMDGGRIVRMGPPRDMVAREVGREVVELRAAPADAAALVAALDGRLRGHRTIGDLLVVYADDADAVEAALRASAVPHRVETRRPATLEDVFLAITGHSLREER